MTREPHATPDRPRKGSLDQRLKPLPPTPEELYAKLGIKCSLYVPSADGGRR